MSKRTVYSRFRDKAELFGAVVHRLVERLRPPNANTEQFFEGASLEAILQRLARLILRAALSPSALALHRVIVAEATRFPELAAAVNQEGARREAIQRIAALLERERIGRPARLRQVPSSPPSSSSTCWWRARSAAPSVSARP